MPPTKTKPNFADNALMLPGTPLNKPATGDSREQQTLVLKGMLSFLMQRAMSASELLAKAATGLRRGLDFEFSASYLAEPAGHALALVDLAGLPQDFAYQARMVPLQDFADVADLPYNGERPACYGDFFAAVASSFFIRSWLVSSLMSKDNQVIGAILLGSRDPHRMERAEAVQILALAGFVAEELEKRFSK
ncbi:MAG TPA: hypothetical protein VFW40_01555 [Capsulimonadaceae bacterium]|nr:hypothetical protein [Capsulimonadaceae bacterium]